MLPRKLLLVDDDKTFVEKLENSFNKAQYSIDVVNTFEQAIVQIKNNKYAAYILDINLNCVNDGFFLGDLIKTREPNASIIIISNAHGNNPITKTLEHKFDHFFPKSLGYEELAEEISEVLALVTQESDKENEKTDFKKFCIITQNDKMLKILSQATSLKNSTNILIEGESGTGKELVARYIGSILAPNGPFITVNCPAIPITLMESTLFGHVKGSFTGADKDSNGKFGEAEGGVIFLDEISCAGLDMQKKLLRVIQNQELERVGYPKKIKCNVKIITSTNENLQDKILKNEFREDLYFRLKRHAIILPLLRERKDDIELLINYFAKDKKNKFTQEVISSLKTYSWPGNVRELENVVYDLLVRTENKNKIILKDIFYLFTNNSTEESNVSGQNITSVMEEVEKCGLLEYLKSLEIKIISKMLTKCKNIAECSHKLKLDSSGLSKKIKKYKIR